jgi:hypothetical protein
MSQFPPIILSTQFLPLQEKLHSYNMAQYKAAEDYSNTVTAHAQGMNVSENL